MAKKLIVCADGTWNTENETDHGTPCPTNVTKIARALLPVDKKGVPQIVRHIDGVGSEFGIKVRGGAVGRGLFHNVQTGYQFLCQNYEEGDQIFLFGFSRGAYTARSLAGLVRNSGILKRGHESQEEKAIELYRDYAPETEPEGEISVRFRAEHSFETDIDFIGVWDTVGALGIPGLDGRFRVLKGLDWQFHDVSLSSRVKKAYHALAIHEHREEFTPTLWEKKKGAPADQILEQVWFSGVHADVGGGYPQTGLSDVTLRWMLDKAESEGNLAFDETPLVNFRPDPMAKGHDSFGAFYKVLDWFRGKPAGILRQYGGAKTSTCESIHPSVFERYRKVPDERWPDSFSGPLKAGPQG
ncbi:MAG TPA: DUF2235 domain-containing protein [Chthoniobacterales bacterium]|nr:DUF2235 domain-containing protein [Chthoniobacterales bacterium]